MERDILSKVIEVEKEIQERLKLEKGKSIEWIEGIKREIEEKISEEEERLKGSYSEIMEKAKSDAEGKAAEILKDAALQAERYNRISDEILKELIERHIIRILPGEYGATKKSQDFGGLNS